VAPVEITNESLGIFPSWPCSLANALARETGNAFGFVWVRAAPPRSAHVSQPSLVRRPDLALASLRRRGLAHHGPTITTKSLGCASATHLGQIVRLLARPLRGPTRAAVTQGRRLALGQISAPPPPARALTNAEAAERVSDCARLRRALL